MATAQAHPADRTREFLEEAARKLRHAVAEQACEPVEPHIVAYCGAVRDRLAALPGRDSRCPGVLTNALDLLEWTRLMLTTRRAMCADQLERAAFADRYLGPETPPSPGVLIDL